MNKMVSEWLNTSEIIDKNAIVLSSELGIYLKSLKICGNDEKS